MQKRRGMDCQEEPLWQAKWSLTAGSLARHSISYLCNSAKGVCWAWGYRARTGPIYICRSWASIIYIQHNLKAFLHLSLVSGSQKPGLSDYFHLHWLSDLVPRFVQENVTPSLRIAICSVSGNLPGNFLVNTIFKSYFQRQNLLPFYNFGFTYKGKRKGFYPNESTLDCLKSQQQISFPGVE